MKALQGKAKSLSIPLYKRGMITKWFQRVPLFDKGESHPVLPFNKGGLGGISKQEGYTLVEVLIALGILGFGLLAVATMQVTAVKTNARASYLSHGTTLAQAKAEELMNLPYSGLNDTTGNGTDEGQGFGLNDTVDPAGECTNDPLSDGFWPDPWDCTASYRLFWNVAVDEPVAESKTVRVIVIWTERGKNKRVSLDFVQTNLS
jgi:prepilin-type N-terminal cleavage/methylation domain-containing protein